MSRFLAIDIGAGTMDILYTDEASGDFFKAVVKSPVRSVAEHAERLPGDLAVSGVEMGGGGISGVLKARAKTNRVVISQSAAATVHHDPARVTPFGITIVPDDEIAAYQADPGFSALTLADLDPERIQTIIDGFDVDFDFDAVCVCAQDHGVAPPGVTHLDYRHRIFREWIDQDTGLSKLLWHDSELPDTLNRLKSLAGSARELPAREVYVMDSGMAAILGASTDAFCRGKRNLIVLDIATSHTVAATVSGGEVSGFFEYHTHDMTPEKLARLLRHLADGDLSHETILDEGGHGAYIRKAIGFDAVEIILATGPKRKMLADWELPVVFGAPLGDNMMTGCAGMLAAYRRRKGLPAIAVL